MAEPTPTPELKIYKGNCHCGAFKFSIKIPELKSVLECNCSICWKKGYMWIFPGAGCFTVEKGEGSLREYEFGKCSMAHKFCPECGTGILGKRHGMAPGMDLGINARALQDVDLWPPMKVNRYDGKALEPAYNPHPFTGPEPGPEIKNGKLYTGSCHCGAVTMALKTKGPLSKEEEVIGECNCSICARLGRILTYRPPSQVSICLTPGTELGSYSFATKQWQHRFCPVCGVSVSVYDTINDLMAVNLRCLDSVEWNVIRIQVFRHSSREASTALTGLPGC